LPESFVGLGHKQSGASLRLLCREDSTAGDVIGYGGEFLPHKVGRRSNERSTVVGEWLSRLNRWHLQMAAANDGKDLSTLSLVATDD